MAYPTTNLYDAWWASDASLGANPATIPAHYNGHDLTAAVGTIVDRNGRRAWRLTTSPTLAFPSGIPWDTQNYSVYILQRLTGGGLMTYASGAPSLYAVAFAGPAHGLNLELFGNGNPVTNHFIAHNRQLLGARCSAAAAKLQIGAIEESKTALDANTGTDLTLYYNNVPGTTSSGVTGAFSDVYKIFVYNGTLSNADHDAFIAAAAAEGFEAATKPRAMIIDGDSRSSGYLLDNIWDEYWPEQFANLHSESPMYFDIAVAGQTLETCVSQAAAEVDPYITKAIAAGYTEVVSWIWSDVNSANPAAGDKTGAQIYAEYQTYAAARRLANPTVKIWGAVSYGMDLSSDPTWTARMADLKALLLADNGATFDRLFRFDQIAALNDGSFTSTYFFPDKVHVKAPGQVLIAQNMYTTLNPSSGRNGPRLGLGLGLGL